LIALVSKEVSRRFAKFGGAPRKGDAIVGRSVSNRSSKRRYVQISTLGNQLLLTDIDFINFGILQNDEFYAAVLAMGFHKFVMNAPVSIRVRFAILRFNNLTRLRPYSLVGRRMRPYFPM
jgi:hypothetical protein